MIHTYDDTLRTDRTTCGMQKSATASIIAEDSARVVLFGLGPSHIDPGEICPSCACAVCAKPKPTA